MEINVQKEERKKMCSCMGDKRMKIHSKDDRLKRLSRKVTNNSCGLCQDQVYVSSLILYVTRVFLSCRVTFFVCKMSIYTSLVSVVFLVKICSRLLFSFPFLSRLLPSLLDKEKTWLSEEKLGLRIIGTAFRHKGKHTLV